MPYIKYMHIGNFWLEFRMAFIFYPFVPGKEDILSNRGKKVHAIISKIENLVREGAFLAHFLTVAYVSQASLLQKAYFSIRYYVLHHYSYSSI
jgi:hypothetical protein